MEKRNIKLLNNYNLKMTDLKVEIVYCCNSDVVCENLHLKMI